MSSQDMKTDLSAGAPSEASARSIAPPMTTPSQVAKHHSVANNTGPNTAPVVPVRELSARKKKQMNYNEIEMAASWDSSSSSETSIVGNHDIVDLGFPQTPAALPQHLTNLQRSRKPQQSTPNPGSAGQTTGGLYDRPSPLVVWKPRSKAVKAQHAIHQQRQKKGRFYTKDTALGQSRASFFQNLANSAQVILMMETTLGMEHHGEDRCQACIDRGIPCVRYIKGASLQIRNCGSACAWCRFHIASGGCSKSETGRKRKRDSPGDEEDGEDRILEVVEEVVEVSARSAGNGTADVLATPDDDDRAKVQDATMQVASKKISQSNLSTSKDPSDQSITRQNSGDHSILCLEALLGKLDDDDADEARALFGLIKRNLEKGRETKSLIDTLTRLFLPLKQRITEKYDRLCNEIAQVAQQKQLFDKFDVAADGMGVDG